MSRPKTNIRKLSKKLNGHGTTVYHVNIPDEYLPLFEYGALRIRIEPDTDGRLILTPIRKEL